MKGIYDFVIKPKDERYNNKIKIGDKTLIVNSNIEDHRLVSRNAVVVATPTAYDFGIKVGEEIIVHHNIFRRWYDVRGNQRNSSQYFKEDLFLCKPDQIYLHKKGENWLPLFDRCFIMPIKDTDDLTTDIEKKCVGIVLPVPKTTNKPIRITKACIATVGIVSASIENGLLVNKVISF